MKKIISALLICAMLITLIASACAKTDKNTYESYKDKKLPKLTDAEIRANPDKEEPNIKLITSSVKQNKRTNNPFKAKIKTCVNANNNKAIKESQRVRLWRDDGESVTAPLWHKIGSPYELGYGSSTMLPGYSYILKARPNTNNGCDVKISGWVCVDYKK